jgi:hypothetical protein
LRGPVPKDDPMFAGGVQLLTPMRRLTQGKNMAYEVWISDNFGEDGSLLRGTYPSAERALAQAQKLIELSLRDLVKPGMSADDLFQQYKTFGDDAWVIAKGDLPAVDFRGWDYARERCEQLANSEGAGRGSGRGNK